MYSVHWMDLALNHDGRCKAMSYWKENIAAGAPFYLNKDLLAITQNMTVASCLPPPAHHSQPSLPLPSSSDELAYPPLLQDSTPSSRNSVSPISSLAPISQGTAERSASHASVNDLSDEVISIGSSSPAQSSTPSFPKNARSDQDDVSDEIFTDYDEGEEEAEDDDDHHLTGPSSPTELALPGNLQENLSVAYSAVPAFDSDVDDEGLNGEEEELIEYEEDDLTHDEDDLMCDEDDDVDDEGKVESDDADLVETGTPQTPVPEPSSPPLASATRQQFGSISESIARDRLPTSDDTLTRIRDRLDEEAINMLYDDADEHGQQPLMDEHNDLWDYSRSQHDDVHRPTAEQEEDERAQDRYFEDGDDEDRKSPDDRLSDGSIIDLDADDFSAPFTGADQTGADQGDVQVQAYSGSETAMAVNSRPMFTAPLDRFD